MLRLLIITLLLYIPFVIQAQPTYYGQGDFGRVEIINDSTLTVSFVCLASSSLVDTCYYYRIGDTIWISTKIKQRFSVTTYNESQIEIKDTVSYKPIILKVYRLLYKRRSSKKLSYQLIGEDVVMINEDNNRIVLNVYSPIYEGDILVIQNYNYVRLRWNYGTTRYAIINQHVHRFDAHVFNDFPLLVKNNKLIPLDKQKQKACWIDNGFYFPVMKLSKKKKFHDCIGWWSMGLQDLPSGFDIPSPANNAHKTAIK